MKSQPLYFVGGATLLAMLPFWTHDVRAGGITPQTSAITEEIAYPFHRSCVVTVDQRTGSKPEYAGQANKITGFVAPDTAEGILIRLDDKWLVLQDRGEENWIPREKVLMIRASR